MASLSEEANSRDVETSKPEPIAFGDPDFRNITLVAEEDGKEQEFMANKTILANSSDVFKRMFFGDFVEKKLDRVEIKQVSIPAFHRLFEVIYSGMLTSPTVFTYKGQWTNSTTSIYTKIDYTFMRHNKLDDSEEQEKILIDFWNYVQDLLAVADRFNIEKSVLGCFQDSISNNTCNGEGCFFCLNLFMFSKEHKLPLDKFSKFKKEQLAVWKTQMEKILDFDEFKNLKMDEIEKSSQFI